MKKKIIAIVLAVAMLAVAVIGGTLAYFTDTDEAENTFVVGNIDIELHEDNNEGALDDAYRTWLADQTIVPDVEIEKDVWVDNVGNNDAYVRVFIQVPATLSPVWPADFDANWTIVATTENEDGSVTYEIWYNTVLGAYDNTTDVLTAIVMDKYTNYDDVKPADELDVLINVEAIQARGFDSAEEAFAALDDQKLVDVDDFVTVATVEELQAAIDAADDGELIRLTADITGDVTVTQQADRKITIDGAGNNFAGVILVDGKSGTIMSAGLTIKNVNFMADTISADACIRLGDGTNATRYVCNVTVSNCTFDVPGAVAVKSYTGGDYNIKLVGCTVNAGMHSALQVSNVEEGLEIVDCKIYSKNGINVNNTPTLDIDGCTINTQGYALRVGVNGTVNTAEKFFNISDSTLACANDDGDATIIFRDNAKFATLTLDNVVLAGDPAISGNVDGTTTIVKDGVTNAVAANTNEELKEAAKNENATIVLSEGTYTLPALKAGSTIICDENVVFEGSSNLGINGSTVIGATFSNPTGDASSSTINGTFKDCDFTGSNALRYCYAGETVVFENCTFSGDLYGVHFDGGANDVVFKNCTISGFNTMGSALTLATFENCTFVANGRSGYNGINLWGDTKMIGCTFVFDGSAGTEWIDLVNDNKTCEFTNCVVTDGTTETPIANVIGNYGTGNTIIIDGVEQ